MLFNTHCISLSLAPVCVADEGFPLSNVPSGNSLSIYTVDIGEEGKKMKPVTEKLVGFFHVKWPSMLRICNFTCGCSQAIGIFLKRCVPRGSCCQSRWINPRIKQGPLTVRQRNVFPSFGSKISVAASTFFDFRLYKNCTSGPEAGDSA